MHRKMYEALLRRFCAEFVLDVGAIREMLDGRKPVPDYLAALFHELLGIQPSAWRQVTSETRALRPPGKRKPPSARKPQGRVATSSKPKQLAPAAGEGVVSFAGSKHATGGMKYTPQGREGLAAGGRRRRRYPTKVHDALDDLGWTVYELAEKLSAELGRPISRASTQFWATGTRQVGPRGKSVSQPVQAPLDVRRAAEKITKGRLKVTDWPNVELEELSLNTSSSP